MQAIAKRLPKIIIFSVRSPWPPWPSETPLQQHLFSRAQVADALMDFLEQADPLAGLNHRDGRRLAVRGGASPRPWSRKPPGSRPPGERSRCASFRGSSASNLASWLKLESEAAQIRTHLAFVVVFASHNIEPLFQNRPFERRLPSPRDCRSPRASVRPPAAAATVLEYCGNSPRQRLTA